MGEGGFRDEYGIYLSERDKKFLAEVAKNVPDAPLFLRTLFDADEHPQFEATLHKIGETVQTRGVEQPNSSERIGATEAAVTTVLEQPMGEEAKEKMWTIYLEQLLSSELTDIDGQHRALKEELAVARSYFNKHKDAEKIRVTKDKDGHYTTDASAPGPTRVYQRNALHLYDQLVAPPYPGVPTFCDLRKSSKVAEKMKNGKGVNEFDKDVLRMYLEVKLMSLERKAKIGTDEPTDNVPVLILRNLRRNAGMYPEKGTSPATKKSKKK